MSHAHYHNVMTDEDYKSFLLWMAKLRDPVAFDIETTGLDHTERGAQILSVSYTTTAPGEETWVIPLGHSHGSWGYKWRQMAQEIAVFSLSHDLIAHNAPFEVAWFRQHTDVNLSDSIYWDTMTVAHLRNENESKRLKNNAAHLMGGDWGIDVKDAARVPWFDLAPYNALDTIATARLYHEQRPALPPALLDLYMSTVRPAQAVLTRVSATGMPLDLDTARAALRHAQTRSGTAAMNLLALAGYYGLDPGDYPTLSWEATSKWFLAFTGAAVEHGDLYVQDTTPSGRASWASGVLNRLAREGYGVAQEILDYRDGSKEAQFLESWIDAADREARVHGQYHVARVRTGRLSSSDPNMQQVKRSLKPVWAAPPGWEFCEIDYSQIEMRVMAEYIHRDVLPDNPLLMAYLEGLDLHRMNATLATGGSVEDVTPGERQAGKAIGFGFLFGMGHRKFVAYAEDTYGVKFTESEAREIRTRFFQRWEGLEEWHIHQARLVQSGGFVTNIFGRRRRLPDAFSTDDFVRAGAIRQAINSPIQSTASDFMLRGLTQIDRREDIQIVGTVHDSVLLLVRSAHDAESAACDLLTSSDIVSVPIEVDISLGPRWGEYHTTRSLRST